MTTFAAICVLLIVGPMVLGLMAVVFSVIGSVCSSIFGPSKPIKYLTEHDKLQGSESNEIKASVLALGRKGAETWCMTKIAAYDPDLTQTELKSAYNNLKAMDMEALGVAIVEVAEL